jgi:2-polyprenyl-3-methyl-5-hydroxy-6-metoxy-1,4-benzoquinol methylase
MLSHRCEKQMNCPVCENAACRPFVHVENRDYWRCDRCCATFLDPGGYVSPEAELQQYRLHRNDVDDRDYRQFLDRLVAPLLERLKSKQQGLDYGCGPGPALAAMLREAGHEVTLYDPYFQPDRAPLARTYDFVTCTEVVEHFHRPAEEFRKLDGLLRDGGWLAVMTCFQDDDAGFAQWHYRRDPTHVVFYREATLRHVAAHHGWRCEIPCKNVALMRKVE